MADFLHVVLLKVRPDTDATLLRTLWDELHKLRTVQGVRGLEIGPAALAVYPDYADRTAGAPHFPLSVVPSGTSLHLENTRVIFLRAFRLHTLSRDAPQGRRVAGALCQGLCVVVCALLFGLFPERSCEDENRDC